MSLIAFIPRKSFFAVCQASNRWSTLLPTILPKPCANYCPFKNNTLGRAIDAAFCLDALALDLCGVAGIDPAKHTLPLIRKLHRGSKRPCESKS
jgi:type IV secretory pathway VirB6-like protein